MNILIILLAAVMVGGCSSSAEPPANPTNPSSYSVSAQVSESHSKNSSQPTPHELRRDKLLAELESDDSAIRRSTLEEVLGDPFLGHDWSVQNQIALLIRKYQQLFKTQNAIEGITHMVESGSSPDLRDATRELLISGIRSEEEEFRLASARAFSRVGAAADIAVLEEILKNAELDPADRSRIREAIAEIGRRPRRDAVLDLLVFGLHVVTDSTKYPDDVEPDVRQFIRRALAVTEPPPPNPLPFSEWEMVFAARMAYERKLAGSSDHPDAGRLAREYVKDLSPCYEWEGFHDCPEHEAEFADKYQATHPDSPLAAYLPLLSAHRWLCVAEAFEYEQKPESAKQSLGLFEARVSVARHSSSAIVRVAAERLFERRRCFAPKNLGS